MKRYFIILCLLSTVGLVSCATTQTNKTTQTHSDQKTDTKQVQKSGTYFGTGVGVGFVSF